MIGQMLIPAEKDWNRYCAIFNRSTQYAPFSAKLDLNILNTHVLPLLAQQEHFAAIAQDGTNEGILHIERYVTSTGSSVGIICLLMADTNKLARFMVEESHAWFRCRNIDVVYAFYYQDKNPYSYILMGKEVYCWAGLYPTINAFVSYGYDIQYDCLIMTLDLPSDPAVVEPHAEGIDFSEEYFHESLVTLDGMIAALNAGKRIGYCGYSVLKAVSENVGKKIGAIWIDVNTDLHGTGIGHALLSRAHHNLYKQGVRKVMLSTNQGLFRAIKFYEKLGYKAESIRGYCYLKELENPQNASMENQKESHC